jgi:hypothetical protein
MKVRERKKEGKREKDRDRERGRKNAKKEEEVKGWKKEQRGAGRERMIGKKEKENGRGVELNASPEKGVNFTCEITDSNSPCDSP